jgi:hypothetical protein
MEMEFSFKGEVWHWRGPSPFHFVSVPKEFSDEIAEVAPRISYGWGAIAVEVTTGETTWTTAIFPKDGLYLVPLRDKIRAAEEIEVGDEVPVSLKLLAEPPHRSKRA